jgi:hypothetical protein
MRARFGEKGERIILQAEPDAATGVQASCSQLKYFSDSQACARCRYSDTLEQLFPRAVPENVFVKHVSRVLNNHGYTQVCSSKAGGGEKRASDEEMQGARVTAE